jgi:hypothetical protein
VIVTSFPPGTASVATAEDAEAAAEVRIPPGPAPVA